ncbi:metal-dependent transcriptional regulator [Bacillus sp. AK128]
MGSPIQEKYLKVIYDNLNDEGFIRVSELAKSLGVTVSSASKMAKKLSEQDYIDFQRYGNITLTVKGIKESRQIYRKHDVLVRFFRLIEIEEEKIEDEVKSIENMISLDVVKKIEALLTNKKIVT